MKNMAYYMKLNYPVSVVQDEEGDFIVSLKDLSGCVADGSTLQKAFKNLEVAKNLWVKSRLAAGLGVPEPEDDSRYSGKVLLRMPKSLHRDLAQKAKEEKVSLNQLINLSLKAAALPATRRR